MRVQSKSNSNEPPSAQTRNHQYAEVEDDTSSEDEIAQDGIPLKQYPTSGSRTKIEDEEAEQEANGVVSIQLRDHEDDSYDPAVHERAGHTEEEITEEEADMASWVGQPAIKGSTESMRMALLTLSLIGLQFTWGIEMTCMLQSSPITIFTILTGNRLHTISTSSRPH